MHKRNVYTCVYLCRSALEVREFLHQCARLASLHAQKLPRRYSTEASFCQYLIQPVIQLRSLDPKDSMIIAPPVVLDKFVLQTRLCQYLQFLSMSLSKNYRKNLLF